MRTPWNPIQFNQWNLPWTELKFLVQHVLESTNPPSSFSLSTRFSPSSTSLPLQLASFTPTQRTQLTELIQKRQTQPLQYVLGWTPFLNLKLRTRPPTLIPRWETEAWTALLIETYHQAKYVPTTVTDVGCGSGCIGLSLVQSLGSHVRLYGYDHQRHALELSQWNAHHHGLHTQAQFMCWDAWTQVTLPHITDVLVANPPYIAFHAWTQLHPDVQQWEDPKALIGGISGLEYYPKLFELAKRSLSHTTPLDVPCMAVEIGDDQGSFVKRMAERYFKKVVLGQDEVGKDRYIWGYGIKR
ncbi:HemK methyltransferase member 1 [Coelomomyces lativittatus]|nr:HemK methyltransferase member 1 [Coelomomyces lativittatus]KAJ1510008.1 HemK methyltransferase member 1 [Coelomomyces lativittatus]